jgi:hypothetical protein
MRRLGACIRSKASPPLTGLACGRSSSYRFVCFRAVGVVGVGGEGEADNVGRGCVDEDRAVTGAASSAATRTRGSAGPVRKPDAPASMAAK